METLNISLAKSRIIRGESQYNRPSRFIKEIPAELIKRTGGETKATSSTAGSGFGKGFGNGFGQEYRSGGSGTRIPSFGKSVSMFSSSAGAKGLSASDIIKRGDFDKNTSKESAGSSLGYEVGDNVKHMKFGVGRVLEIKNAGRDYEVLVNFETAGQKRMFASFAKLKKL